MLTTSFVPDLLAAARALIPAIEAVRDRLDVDCRLPDELIRAMAEAGLFRMAVPACLGGLEVDPFTLSDVIEELSYADGAVGWVVAIGAGTASVASAGLPEEAAREIYGHDPLVVTCGNLAVPGGKAAPVPGGYRVTGRWPFGSGSLHSTWLAGHCAVMDGDGPRMKEDGTPEARIMMFPAADVEILDTWHVAGLRGTGSHDYAVADVFVPEERTIPRGGSPRHPGSLYATRFYLLAHASHALGIARRAIDAFSDLAGAKQQPRSEKLLRERAAVQEDVARAEALVGTARAYLMEVTRDLWETVTAGRELTDIQRARARLAMTTGVRQSAEAVDLMYEAGGGTS
ncbi:MAG TPA: acyl-CoA dehydrogenase family protein, partial [Vicinamibacteria bacterium]|nr:acyl-CoA dehydrogenase family protein [Vicinamibacteria bacterium]